MINRAILRIDAGDSRLAHRITMKMEALAKPTRSPTRVVIPQRSDGIPPGYC